MNTPDKRAQRTQQALLTAWEELTVALDYHEITVTKLTQAAGINRKTFYLHYDSIDDLLDTLADRIAEQLTVIIRRHAIKDIYQHPGSCLDDIIAYNQGHQAVVQRLLFSDDYSHFTRRIEQNLAHSLEHAIQKSYLLSDSDAQLVAYFLIHNTSSLFGYYMRQTPHQAFDRTAFKAAVERLNHSGISSFFGPHTALSGN